MQIRLEASTGSAFSKYNDKIAVLDKLLWKKLGCVFLTTIVLDIETVATDRIDEYKEKFEPEKKSSKKVLKSDKPGLHWLTGKVICICIKPLGKSAITFCDEDENLILSAFYEELLKLRPVNLVTFNGQAFDIPFLYMRGLVYGLDFSALLPREKWSKLHVDLYEHLGGKLLVIEG